GRIIYLVPFFEKDTFFGDFDARSEDALHGSRHHTPVLDYPLWNVWVGIGHWLAKELEFLGRGIPVLAVWKLPDYTGIVLGRILGVLFFFEGAGQIPERVIHLAEIWVLAHNFLTARLGSLPGVSTLEIELGHIEIGAGEQ